MRTIPLFGGEIFIEGVADRHEFKYRIHHRPTGVVRQLSFPQRRRPPPFPEIVQELHNLLSEALSQQAGGFHFVPVA